MRKGDESGTGLFVYSPEATEENSVLLCIPFTSSEIQVFSSSLIFQIITLLHGFIDRQECAKSRNYDSCSQSSHNCMSNAQIKVDGTLEKIAQ